MCNIIIVLISMKSNVSKIPLGIYWDIGTTNPSRTGLNPLNKAQPTSEEKPWGSMMISINPSCHIFRSRHHPRPVPESGFMMITSKTFCLNKAFEIQKVLSSAHVSYGIKANTHCKNNCAHSFMFSKKCLLQHLHDQCNSKKNCCTTTRNTTLTPTYMHPHKICAHLPWYMIRAGTNCM